MSNRYFHSGGNTPIALSPLQVDEGMANGLQELTEAELQAFLNIVNSVHELASAAIAQVNAEYTRLMGNIADVYPSNERETWAIQTQEARALIDSEKSNTPWIDACAKQRGIERKELAEKILENDKVFRELSGFYTGVRQWHVDCINMLLEGGEDSRQELESYDYLQGWKIHNNDLIPVDAEEKEQTETGGEIQAGGLNAKD